MFFVTDLRHFEGIELDPDAPAPASRLAAYLRRIVRAATAVSETGVHASALSCRRRPGHRPCKGRLVVERHDVPSEIRWECPACGEAGVIDGWQGSLDDLSAPSELEEDAPLTHVVVSEPGYKMMLDELSLDPDCERLVYLARPHPTGVELWGTEEEFEELAGAIAFEANHAATRDRQRRWDAIAACLKPKGGSSLEKSADFVIDELGRLGLVASRTNVTEMLRQRLAAAAEALGISEESAGQYLDEEGLRGLAREAAVSLADEQPGADLLSQPRIIPMPLQILGRSIAALAEAAQIRELNADDVGVHGALQLISLMGQSLHERPVTPNGPILLPQAALTRGARLLEATVQMIREGALTTPDIPSGAMPDLTEAFARDARTLRALVSEHGTSARDSHPR